LLALESPVFSQRLDPEAHQPQAEMRLWHRDNLLKKAAGENWRSSKVKGQERHHKTLVLPDYGLLSNSCFGLLNFAF
jgi:hypothetical protein